MNTMTTYKIGDHPNKADVIEKHRDINVDIHDWYECTIDDWKERLGEMGFYDPDIQFSGFWSQGDGASFTSRSVPGPHTDPDVVEAWNNLVGAAALIGETITEDLRALAYGGVARTNHRYYHENTVSVDWNWDDPPYGNYELPTEGMKPFADALIASVERYFEDLDERVRSLCRQIYDDLEKEYEYLTSDEAVEETLEANGYDFDEEGDIA